MKLKEWKESNDLSYAELAERLGVSRSFAYKMSAGLHFPTAEVLLRIKKVTHGAVSADDMLAGLSQ